MNRENVEKLRDFLRDEVSDKRFNMRYIMRKGQRGPQIDGPAREVLKECGTAACVAGWAEFLFSSADFDLGMGLSASQYFALTIPSGFDHHPRKFARLMAVETLTRLLETGEVRWPDAAP